jgi:hypothetical protein
MSKLMSSVAHGKGRYIFGKISAVEQCHKMRIIPDALVQSDKLCRLGIKTDEIGLIKRCRLC